MTAPADLRPAAQLIQIEPDGRASIRGFRCAECGTVVSESTLCCRNCTSRVPPVPYSAAETGTLHSWTIVHRSFPGVAVPFVSAIVDLDDGLTVKGTLKGIEHDGLKPDLPIRLHFDTAGGAVDKDGNPYVGFHFEPLGADA